MGENLSIVFVDNDFLDQPPHQPHSVISAFVIGFLFKALFTEFCNCACKRIAMLSDTGHFCVAFKHGKTELSLKTSSEINFECIKFVQNSILSPFEKK